MIYDVLASLNHYSPLVSDVPAMKKIIKSRDWTQEKVGEYSTGSENLHCVLVEYPLSSIPSPYEVYEEKSRLHYIVQGEELMGLSWREHARNLPFDQEGRAELSADPIGVIHAKEGHFVLFMPGEPHTGGMESSTGKSSVRKLIFTISD